jgi:late competence protein required for DNA uptake (superfamily II DNA/RNA helicase)
MKVKNISNIHPNHRYLNLESTPIKIRKIVNKVSQENTNVSLKKIDKSSNKIDFSRVIIDEDILVEEVLKQHCQKCNKQKWNYEWKTWGSGICPTLEITCKNCTHTQKVQTSAPWFPPQKYGGNKNHRVNQSTALLFVAILLTGLTLAPVSFETI